MFDGNPDSWPSFREGRFPGTRLSLRVLSTPYGHYGPGLLRGGQPEKFATA